jgi:hypothetical protein
MAQFKVNVDRETLARLIEAAVAERRPVPWQAEVILRRAMGLPFPLLEPAELEPEPVAAGPVEAKAVSV